MNLTPHPAALPHLPDPCPTHALPLPTPPCSTLPQVSSLKSLLQQREAEVEEGASERQALKRDLDTLLMQRQQVDGLRQLLQRSLKMPITGASLKVPVTGGAMVAQGGAVQIRPQSLGQGQGTILLGEGA